MTIDHLNGERTTGTVLYIEDNPINTMLVERILQARPGVELRTAPDGRTGLEQAGRQPPDLVLLDLQLPDMSGEQVLAELRTGRATGTIPVAVLSADIDPVAHDRLLTGGARYCLNKPYQVTDLLCLVDMVLQATTCRTPSCGAALSARPSKPPDPA